jgi:flavin-dependent dehydrogenase
MGITASFRGMETEPGIIEMHMLPEAYCGVVRQGDGVTHVGLAFPHRKGEIPGGAALEPFLTDALGRFPALRSKMKRAKVEGPVKAFGPMAVRSRRRAGDGALLVGDAAGFVDPVTGHGIGFAMRSASLAAGPLLEAHAAGDYSTPRLGAYAREYDREFRSALRFYGGIQLLLHLPRPALSLLGIVLDRYPAPIRALIPRLVGSPSQGTPEPAHLTMKNCALLQPIKPGRTFGSPLPQGEGPGVRSSPSGRSEAP